MTRDAYGIPTVHGGSHADVLFGLGVAVGQDRTFQLEFIRRASSGTLAELLGRPALGVDRLVRRIGYRRAARAQWEATPADGRALLSAYAQGINVGMARARSRRPHELALLRVDPMPWDPVDVLAFVKVIASALSTNWDTELARLRVAAVEGLEALIDCDPGCAPGHAVSAPPGTSVGRSLARTAAEIERLGAYLPMVGASNNWVVSGARSATGTPLVASDPHLNPTSPSYWYLARLVTPSWDVSGATLAGAPAVIIGQNDHLAWSVTAGRADESDLFLEDMDRSGTLVRRGGAWSPVDIVDEDIEVRFGRNVREQVRITDRGPLVVSADDGEEWNLSLAATWLDDAPLRGFFELPAARTPAELRSAFEGWVGPPVNLCFAAVDGSIGWQLAATVPGRERWALLPQLPSRDDGWTVRRSGDELPWAEDGPQGWYATANNQPVTPCTPDLGDDWVDGYRVGRIGELLSSRTDWDVPAFQAMQLDTHLGAWSAIRPHVERVQVSGSDAQIGQTLLLGWDGDLRPRDPAAAVAESFLHELATRLYRHRAPEMWATLLGGPQHELSAFTGFYSRRLSFVVGVLDARPARFAPEVGWDELIGGALGAAVRELRERRGDDPGRWWLGALRPLRFVHPLSRLPGMGALFDLGPFEVGGGLNTVAMAAPDPRSPWQDVVASATVRAVIDVSDPRRSRYAVAGGQSGNPCSPHIDDQLLLWRRGEGVPIVGDRPDRSGGVLTLVPG
ncbi:MAG: penicillin acylase family protein [Acidimicrobiales bacterium]|nr:penicillin acylase family protein [Acidimicrobiales bacterium]